MNSWDGKEVTQRPPPCPAHPTHHTHHAGAGDEGILLRDSQILGEGAAQGARGETTNEQTGGAAQLCDLFEACGTCAATTCVATMHTVIAYTAFIHVVLCRNQGGVEDHDWVPMYVPDEAPSYIFGVV